MSVAASIPLKVCPDSFTCPAGFVDPSGKGCPDLSLCRFRALGVDIAGLLPGRTVARYARGERIPPAPDRPGAMRLRLVRSGLAAAAVTLDDGRRQLVKLFVPGEMIWPTATRDGDIGAEALADAEIWDLVLAWDRAAEAEGRVAGACLQMCAESLDAAVSHLALLGRYSGIERLCAFLADMAARLGEPNARGYGLTLPMSRQDIADYLGLSPETVSRLFSRLRDMGALQLASPTRIEIRDYAAVASHVPVHPTLGRFAGALDAAAP